MVRVTPDIPRLEVDGTLELTRGAIAGESVELTLDRRALDVLVSVISARGTEPASALAQNCRSG
jgi:hypothetical protein